MTYIKPRPVALIVLLFALGGLSIGLSLPWLKEFSKARFGRTGFAMAFVINIAMPVWIAAISALYPRVWVAIAGAFAATVGFFGALGFSLPAATTHWLRDLIGDLGPIPTIAALGYLGLAALTSWAVGTFRRVGLEPGPSACTHCSYLLIGITSERCPECGQLSLNRSAAK